jgi:hypothetical protein
MSSPNQSPNQIEPAQQVGVAVTEISGGQAAATSNTSAVEVTVLVTVPVVVQAGKNDPTPASKP